MEMMEYITRSHPRKEQGKESQSYNCGTVHPGPESGLLYTIDCGPPRPPPARRLALGLARIFVYSTVPQIIRLRNNRVDPERRSPNFVAPRFRSFNHACLDACSAIPQIQLVQIHSADTKGARLAKILSSFIYKLQSAAALYHGPRFLRSWRWTR
jgi:hypothetical protein